MSTPNPRPNQAVNQRRSQRILVSVPISVSGTQPTGAVFVEDTSTLIVNAHGGLILLKEKVFSGQIVTIKHVMTNDEIDCTVIDVTLGSEGIPEIGLEFQKANPIFWHVSFPPTDWSPRSPEAKHYVQSPVAQVPSRPTLAKK